MTELYTRLYKFYDAEFGLKNLKDSRLKISTISDLNDPFEFMGYRFKDRKERVDWRGRIKSYFKNKGIICFCRDWRNPVIWSHYADKHRGIALGFDVQSYGTIPVKYRTTRLDRPNKTEVLQTHITDLMQNSIAYKFSHWKYEKEVRTLENLDNRNTENGLYFKEFDACLRLKEIIIGCRSEITSKTLHQNTDLKGIEVRTARLAFKSFDVVQQRLKRLRAQPKTKLNDFSHL